MFGAGEAENHHQLYCRFRLKKNRGWFERALCHKTVTMKKFIIRKHKMLRVKTFPKWKAPNLSPVESKANKPVKISVCTNNRSYSDIDDVVVRNGRRFLRKYTRSYET